MHDRSEWVHADDHDRCTATLVGIDMSETTKIILVIVAVIFMALCFWVAARAFINITEEDERE